MHCWCLATSSGHQLWPFVSSSTDDCFEKNWNLFLSLTLMIFETFFMAIHWHLISFLFGSRWELTLFISSMWLREKSRCSFRIHGYFDGNFNSSFLFIYRSLRHTRFFRPWNGSGDTTFACQPQIADLHRSNGFFPKMAQHHSLGLWLVSASLLPRSTANAVGGQTLWPLEAVAIDRWAP